MKPRHKTISQPEHGRCFISKLVVHGGRVYENVETPKHLYWKRSRGVC
jgi:hypothetical protein